ncbi:MAG: NTP transferase domain-containing protein [Actinomycetaceae bacterium]|nr:NTP transferase domain-containing protein [Actinomycetaceae bacterium]
MTDFHAIIPAGGAGTRLWPLSRSNAPKFLADLTNAGQSLLQATVRRLESLTGENIVVVTGRKHAFAVSRQLRLLAGRNIIVEPSPRDSMAAIGLATAVIAQRYGDVVVGSFAADHLIADEEAFHDAVREAIAAAKAGYVVTIGITPDHAATGFGYIHATEVVDGLTRARAVSEFLEKPDAHTAQEYVASGKYLWNAGMFVARTSVLLGALERFEPELHAGIMRLATAWDTSARDEVLAEEWPKLKKIAIDHAIAEPLAAAGGVAVVPVEMGWSDVGDYASLRDVQRKDAQSPDVQTPDAQTEPVSGVAPGGSLQPVISRESPGALVYTHSKPVALLGIPNAVVVETADAILVTTRDHAQSVKNIVDDFDGLGLEHLR